MTAKVFSSRPSHSAKDRRCPRRRTTIVWLLCSLAACQHATNWRVLSAEGDDYPEARVSGLDIRASQHRVRGAWQSERLAALPTARRVGIGLSIDPGESLPSGTLQARGGDPLGATGAWLDATTTWQEGRLRVAHVDLGGDFGWVQVRLAGPVLPSVDWITFSALNPEPSDAALRSNVAVPDIRRAQALDTRSLDPTLENLGVHPRADWGARPTTCTTTDGAKTRLTVHHTAEYAGVEDFPAMLRFVQSLHMDNNGWCDIGYHFLSTVDGQLWEGRPLDLLGTHTGGENDHNIGVSFAGCFDDDPYCSDKLPRAPPEEMVGGGGELIGWLAQMFGWDPDGRTVKGHRDYYSGTVCPGEYLYARMGDLRDIAASTPLGKPDAAPTPDGSVAPDGSTGPGGEGGPIGTDESTGFGDPGPSGRPARAGSAVWVGGCEQAGPRGRPLAAWGSLIAWLLVTRRLRRNRRHRRSGP